VNARDAMPDGGTLRIETDDVVLGGEHVQRHGGVGAKPGPHVALAVSDSGAGMDYATAARIFEPFFTTKPKGKGTGLGLSTVYGIIKQTGGFVYPESELGKGTAFRIFLPRHVAGADELQTPRMSAINGALAAAEEVARLSAATADDTGRGTILLVEDEEGLRGLNARGLVSRGYTVLQAGNGVEAIEVIDQHDGTIDLVVSDVVMPEMDGPSLLKELRRRKPELKIIFVSGYAEEAFAKNIPEGQHAFLAKPFTLKQLVAAVKETMAS